MAALPIVLTLNIFISSIAVSLNTNLNKIKWVLDARCEHSLYVHLLLDMAALNLPKIHLTVNNGVITKPILYWLPIDSKQTPQ